MKKFWGLGIILAAYIPLCGICGSEGRKNLPLRKAILGHWRKVKRKSSECQYRPTFQLVSKFKSGSSGIQTWRIISESGETLKIKVVGVSSWDESIYELEQEMKFSEDRNSISVTSTTMQDKSQKGKVRTFDLTFTGCDLPSGFFNGEDRRDLPLWKALLGNWKKTWTYDTPIEDYYSALFKLIRKRRAKKGRVTQYKWRIVSESGDTLKISVNPQRRGGITMGRSGKSKRYDEYKMKFSEDRNNIAVTETIIKSPYKRKGESLEGKVSTYELIYVDGKQRP